MRCGGNISLPQGLLPPPSSSPTLCPVILLLGALNVQVTKHTLQRGRHGVGGAGRCWRSCFTAQGALQPSQGWSRKQSAPRGICPHPAPGHPDSECPPHFLSSLSHLAKPIPGGPGLSAQGWGPASSRVSPGVRQPPRPSHPPPLLPLFGWSHLVSSVPASSGSPCPGLSPPRLPELNLTASCQRAVL